MKTASLFLFFFCVSVAVILLKEGAVDAGRVLKKRNIVTCQADKNPCDQHNFLNRDHKVEGILKNKLPSGPSPGVGHKYIDSLSPVNTKRSNAANKLKINKLPSGPSGGVGHKYINAAGSMKPSVIHAERLITTFDKLPSGPSGGVGHSYND
jgi:hypothetical protein